MTYGMMGIGDEYMFISRNGCQGHVIGGTESRRSMEDGIGGLEYRLWRRDMRQLEGRDEGQEGKKSEPHAAGVFKARAEILDCRGK